MRPLVLALYLCLASFTAIPARAEPVSDMSAALVERDPIDAVEWEIGAIFQASSSPYRGVTPECAGLPIINHESRYLFIRGNSLGFKAVNTDWLEISLFGEYNSIEFDRHDSNDARMKRLTNRHSGIVGGAMVRILTPAGMLLATAAWDLMGQSDGWTGKLAYGYAQEFGPIEIGATVGVLWSDRKFNDYYYGVTSRESAESGLSAYRAGGGLSPYAQLNIVYSFDEHWSCFAFCGATLICHNITRSPMVSRTATYDWGLGLTYTF